MIQSQLNTLQKKIRRKQKLEALIPKWQYELQALSQQTENLHAAMLLEQNDVDKLEAGGIGTVFHKLTGRMEEKLDKERMEAKTAAAEYQTAADDLKELQARLTEAQEELKTLDNCREEYIELMLSQIRQTEAVLSDSCTEEHTEELKLLLQLQRRRKSLREALLESSEAACAAQDNLDYLNKLKKLPEELETAPEEENHLTKIESLAVYLVEELTDLQAKLAQMGIDPEPHLSIGPYLKAPAAFIAGRSSDFTPLDQIGKAIVQIEDISNQIIAVDSKLEEALTQVEARLTHFSNSTRET